MRNWDNNVRKMSSNRVVGDMPTVQPASTKILENILDMGSTIAKILTTCGIEGAKATKAVSSITQAFLHFDEKQFGDYGLCKTRHLRKEDLLKNLQNDCCMSETEANLAVSVVKCAFRAFYHKQSVRKYDPTLYSKDNWQQAAERTIIAYAKAGATKSELELAACRIQEAYKGYLDRVSYKRTLPYNYENICNDLHRTNCYHCSSKNPKEDTCLQINQTNDQTIPKQVTCTCCGCLRKPGAIPAAYRNTKGRSIILVEDNNMYYNRQVMKQGCDALNQSICCAFNREQCEANLSQALYKLTRDMINRIIKNEGSDVLPIVEQEGNKILPGFKNKTNNNQQTSSNKSTQENYKFSGRKGKDDCDCGDKHKVKNRRRREILNSSSEDMSEDYGSSAPPNSLTEIYDKNQRRTSRPSNPDAIVEIALKGNCHGSTSGRARIDIVGLRLLDKEYGGSSDFVCKRRICTKNRYTQTDGSAHISASTSSTSAVNTPDKRRSTPTVRSQPSRVNSIRQETSEFAQNHDSNSDEGNDDEQKLDGEKITLSSTRETEASIEGKVEEIYVRNQDSYNSPEESFRPHTSIDIITADANDITEVANEEDRDTILENDSLSMDESGQESVKEKVKHSEENEELQELQELREIEVSLGEEEN